MVDRGRLDYLKNLSFVDPRIRSRACNDITQPLPESYEPGSWEVLCSGGKKSFDHIGNRRFRICIANNLRTYENAKSKHQKSLVVTTIVDAVKESSTQERGGFVRRDPATGRWFEVEDKIAREKVGHALRDAIKLAKKQTKKRDVVTSSPESPQKRPRTEQSSAPGKSNDCRSAPEVALPRSAGTPFDRSGRTHGHTSQRHSKPTLISEDDDGSTGDRSGSSLNDWEKSLEESADKFCMSDCEDDGDPILSKMAREASTPNNPDPVLTLLNLASISNGFSEPSLVLDKSHGLYNRNPFGSMSRRVCATQNQTNISSKPSNPLVWKPPGSSKTEGLYEEFIRSMPMPMENFDASGKFPMKDQHKARGTIPTPRDSDFQNWFASSFP
eukprot:scaffold26214_cov142-Cylindrotheca_fusiformis.AAC.2